MRRYWFDGESQIDETAKLTDDLFHHICGVCRQDVGSKFELLKDGRAYLVEIISRDKKEAKFKIIEERQIEPLKKPYIRLCLSLPKLAKVDFILEKSVELGVSEVELFLSDFSFIKLQDKISNSKRLRWEKIVKSATQQCGRGDLLKINNIKHRDQLLEDFNRSVGAVGLFFYEGTSSLDIQSAISHLQPQELNEIWLFVGSEGGFSDLEVKQFARFGLQPVTMGQQVLRVETACLAAVSVIKYHFGLMK